jgi:hypothetical protein
VCARARVRVCVCLCVCVRVRACVFMCLCVYICTNDIMIIPPTGKDSEGGRERERERSFIENQEVTEGRKVQRPVG